MTPAAASRSKATYMLSGVLSSYQGSISNVPELLATVPVAVKIKLKLIIRKLRINTFAWIYVISNGTGMKVRMNITMLKIPTAPRLFFNSILKFFSEKSMVRGSNLTIN